jgi:MerR family transcriptional regulator/heat shock protein HspR
MDTDTRFVVTVAGSARVVRMDEPLYVISIAAEMAGMHPQTLRQYDRLGLVSPGRAGGGGRRYSLRDIEMLREVQRLSQDEGVNLAGIKRIIELEAEVHALRAKVAELAWVAGRPPSALWPAPRRPMLG